MVFDHDLLTTYIITIQTALEATVSAMCVELESVREQHMTAQQTAQEEKKAIQQQLHTAQERLTSLTAENKTKKVYMYV